MSTNLQLCADLRQEATDTGTGPTTVVGQTGELGRYVKWIKDAWVDIQNHRPDWLWMRKSFTVPTVASTGEYAYNATGLVDTVSGTAISRWSRWYRYEFKIYLASTGVSGETPLIWLPWNVFRRIYRYGTQNDGPPVHVSVDPTGKFCLGPKPDAVYTVGGDYQLGPQEMTADADVPEMPSRFHRLIVYEALSRYGGHRVVPEAIMRANAEGGRLWADLELDQLPDMEDGPPLA
ncbi:MAG: hypothetical protein M0Z99_33960 [Betaproteobacteria bacterium]|nr:hypothetical protein [Betaproteobacteria bacterium]